MCVKRTHICWYGKCGLEFFSVSIRLSSGHPSHCASYSWTEFLSSSFIFLLWPGKGGMDLLFPSRHKGVWNSFVAAVITGNSSFRCILDNVITQMQLVLHTCQPSTPLSIRTWFHPLRPAGRALNIKAHLLRILILIIHNNPQSSIFDFRGC